MLAAVVRGTVFAVSTALGLTGCFSASFLDDTCERLPGGCGGVSTGGSTSGTGSTSGGEVPTTSGTTAELSSVGSSSGTTGESLGLLFEGPAFRIDEMRIVDPHLFISEFACVDAFSFINSGLTTTVATKETNLIFLAKELRPGRGDAGVLVLSRGGLSAGRGLLPAGRPGAADGVRVVQPRHGGLLHGRQ
jgi:hypothetical protein